MIKHFAMAALVSAASLAFVAVAQADDFPATPMNPGPIMMGGIPIPPINVVAPFDAVLGGGKPAPAPMAAPMKHRMKHHMKKKMMMK